MSAAQPDSGPDLEELLLDTLDAVSRVRVGQREAVAAALDAGRLLSLAKGRIPHGGWSDWLNRVGVKPRTASGWMRLAAMGVDVDDVIDRGGINATLAGKDMQDRESKAEVIIGEGEESVYGWYLPAYRELSEIRGTDRFPIKVGKAKGDPIKRALAHALTAPEMPVLGFCLKVEDSSKAERLLHKCLVNHGLNCSDSLGNEWFYSNPQDLREICSSLHLDRRRES